MDRTVPDSWVSAVLQEEDDNLCVSLPGGPVQRRRPQLPADSVYLGTLDYTKNCIISFKAKIHK